MEHVAAQDELQSLQGEIATLLALADLLRERNDLAAALRYATEAVQRSRQSGDMDFQLLSSHVLARVKQASGEIAEALAEVHRTQQRWWSFALSR